MTSLLMATAILCSSADVQDSFLVRAPVPDVANWMIAHQNDVVASMKCRVVQRSGDRVRVVKETAVGVFEFVSQEQITQDGSGNIYYKSRLLQSIRGGMTENSIDVSLRQYGASTLVTISGSVSVSGVSPFQVQVGANTAKRGFRNLMERAFR